MGFDSENAMREEAVGPLQDALGNCNTEVFSEFSYGAGKTDLVVANISDVYLQRRVRGLDLDCPIDPAYLRAFVLIHSRDKITRQYFDELYKGKRTAEAVLSWLQDRGFVEVTGQDKIRTTPHLRRHVTTSYAVELKLRKWQGALKQAYRAKSYSDYQYIAIDESHLTPALENQDRFEKYGVGIISVGESGDCTVHYHPDRCNPATSLTAWKLNEQTLNAPTFNQVAAD